MRIDNAVAVSVLQHPQETRHARGTAIIAQLCLQNYACWIDEDFSAHRGLRDLLRSGSPPLLVYPAPHARPVNTAATDDAEVLLGFHPRRLLFIDANWRKARKIWHATPALHDLPCITLNGVAPSNYRIRKSPSDAHLSTVEAMVASLGWLDRSQDYTPMLDIFDRMIERQIEHMGQSVYRDNYLEKNHETTRVD